MNAQGFFLRLYSPKSHTYESPLCPPPLLFPNIQMRYKKPNHEIVPRGGEKKSAYFAWIKS